MLLRYIVRQLRIKSWIKNVFILIPAIFALELFDAQVARACALVFFAFCMISSAVYIFNDIRDIDIDRKHPIKRNRPIPSGALSVKAAWVLAAILALAAFSAALCTNAGALLIIVFYAVENILYSIWLKHIPILDAFCIALGFILRVWCGGVASGVLISDWLLLTIVSMSLFMAFGKRYGEMLMVEEQDRRIVLKHYDIGFLNAMMFVCAGLSTVFYALWAMNRGKNMIYTVPVIIFIICEYLFLVHGGKRSSGDPTTVIFDSKVLMISIGILGTLILALLYYGG